LFCVGNFFFTTVVQHFGAVLSTILFIPIFIAFL